MNGIGWEGLLTAILGAGGLAAIVATITKYWLESRKQDVELADRTVDRVYQRVDQLEKMHSESLDENTTLHKQIGLLESEIRELVGTISDLRSQVETLTGTINELRLQVKHLTVELELYSRIKSTTNELKRDKDS